MSNTGREDAGGPAPAGPESGRPLRVLQITDTHLYADPDGSLLGQPTRRTLDLVLELARARFWPVDRLLLTGDLVHDERPEGYRYLAGLLRGLGLPFSAIPGNHDAPALLAEILLGGDPSPSAGVRCGDWNLVSLDSTLRGEDGGHLEAAEIERLDRALAAEPDVHALVCLHHQPIPVGSAWIDTMALDNPGDFFAVLDRHPQVRGVLWGHVHQAFSARRGGLSLMGSPSTCIQFLPGSEDFAIDALTPGFRWLLLHPDGRIETGIERVGAYPEPLDLATGGY